MNVFTIRDIENLCGIKAHTLRTWEQRYRLLIPKRKAGNHRLYDSEDLKQLLRISFLYHNGHKISKLAQLSEMELNQLTLSASQTGSANDIFVNHLLEASIDFDQDLFDRVLHNIMLHMGFEKAITQVAWPFLEKIGLLWLTGHVVPAHEHFASALITKKLLVAINGLESADLSDSGQRNILLYTPRGEFHEMPVLFMRYLMKKNGLPTIYFGKNIGLEELYYYCRHQPVTDLYFHMVTNLLRCEPDHYLKQLTAYFPDKQIVVSGVIGAAINGNYPNVRVLKSLDEMLQFAKEK